MNHIPITDIQGIRFGNAQNQPPDQVASWERSDVSGF